MARPKAGPAAGDFREVLSGGGDVGRNLLRVDWEATPLGPPEDWPRSLQTMVRVLLTSRFSMWMAWGPELTFFCNEAYRRDTLGKKYPWALGRPAQEVWAEIWPEIGPRIETVISTGQATWDESLLLFLERSGYVEETYHTFSYSPLPGDDGRIAGMLCVVSEDTERVVGERRMATLRDLGDVPATIRGEREFLQAASEQLARNPRSLPFTAVYLFDEDGVAHLAATTGLSPGHPAAPDRIDPGDPTAPWPVAKLADAGEILVVDDLGDRFDSLPCGAWDDPPTSAMLAPLPETLGGRPYGFLVVGANPYGPVAADYRSFVGLIAQRLASGIASARGYEAERRRAEQLAELDRAKTAFFSNVSHEFRTPLTLMLGPLQDAVEEGDGLEAGQVRLVRRNGVRLLKLVNALLDFSRLEAGRMQARFRPVDLARLTADLAGTFSDATRRAGLELDIACEALPKPVYVDADLWERIVLNLLSNAFKVTLTGRISVALAARDGHVELEVADTGPGIPAGELDRIFERFHQVKRLEARSYEGTGIGLSLVKELVELHGGEISVESVVGEGSCFRVRVPQGRAHLPAEQVEDSSAEHAPGVADLFVEEALSWLPSDAEDEAPVDLPEEPSAAPRPTRSGVDLSHSRVLVVDDNPDLRRYLQRLLSPYCRVRAVADGRAALEAVREDRPDLVVTDVMMPGIDGFELLRRLRADPETAELPIVMLSARAGEEASIEGLEAGADDYLPKPFSGRELIARVRSHLELSLVRRQASEDLRAERLLLQQTLDQLPAGVILAEAPEGRIVLANAQVADILGHPLIAAESVAEYDGYRALSDNGGPRDPRDAALARAILDGEVIHDEDQLYAAGDGRQITLRVSAAPIRDPSGRIVAGVSVFQDVTERVRTERLIAAQRDILAMIADGRPLQETLDEIVRCVEALAHERVRGSILLRSRDGRHLETGAAPSLPAAYNQAIDGLEIGPVAGSCGTAAHRRETVVVTDTLSDPLWEPFRDLAAEHGLQACWSVPILATDGALVGTLAVYHDEPHEPSAEDRRVVELLARTAAVAIERSRDAEARTRQLQELQSSLLPRALPDVRGIAVTATFHPGDATLDVGGDFYDLFPLPDGGWGFVVGDVCGHGAEAAAVTALTRHTTRAVARLAPEPAAVLAFVSDALRASGYDRFCTAVYGCLTVADRRATVRLASGGHPPPLVRRADGRVESLEAHGPLLGVLEDVRFPEMEVELGRGDTLVLYTDGLIERNPRLPRGAADLAALVDEAPGGLLVDRIEELALGAPGGRPRDDVAILALAVE